MIKPDIIKTYIGESNYYIDDDWEYFKMFNNNNLYLFIKIYNSESYSKTKQIKENYIISIYFNYHGNNISFDKIKNYDNTKIDIIDDYYDYYFNYDLRITNNEIIKKLEKYIYIIYYNKKYILKDGFNIKANRHHEFNNINCYYSKKYISFYINYYIIIYNDIKRNNIKNKSRKCNTIFCNFSRNFMLFI